jgi:hypothetical protein
MIRGMHWERASRWPRIPGWAAVVVGVYLLLVLGLQVVSALRGAEAPFTCHFRLLTGHPCPTCGTTRMVLALAQGRLAWAWQCNPLMFLLLTVGLLLLGVRVVFRRRLVWPAAARHRGLLIILGVAALLLNWLYLLLLSPVHE